MRSFRNWLALVTVVGIIPGLWVAQGIKFLEMPEVVIGATIMAWGLILNFYFRKRPTDEAK